VSHRENFDVVAAPPIRDDVVSEDEPSGAREETGPTGVWEPRELLLGAFECFQEALSGRPAVLLKVSRDFPYFRRCTAGAEDADCHRLFGRFALEELWIKH